MKRKGLRQLIVYVLLLALLTGCGMGSGAGTETSQYSRPSHDAEMSGNSERSERSEMSLVTQDSTDRSQSVKNEPMSMTINGAAYEGTFTGILQGGLPEGNGSFSSGEFVFKGNFAEGKITDGNLTDFPLTITVGETEMSGTYNGEVQDGMVTGKGSFDADPFTYRGAFTAGVPTGEGQVTALPMSQKLAGQTYSGFYKGTVRDLTADGEGTFEAGSVSYKGSFSAGVPSGGLLTDCPMTVDFHGQTVSGKYTGTMTNGVIAGEGTLTSDTFSYTGTFAEDVPTGSGDVTGYAFTVVFQDYSFAGVYEGKVESFVPEGTGKFEAPADADGFYMNFSGTFAAGGLQDGTLDTNHCKETLTDHNDGHTFYHLGTYQGAVAGGLLNGPGHFSGYSNLYNYEYDGEFHDGKPNGVFTYTYHLPEGDLLWDKKLEEGKVIWRSIEDYFGNLIADRSLAESRFSLTLYNFIRSHRDAFNGLTGDAELKALANNVVTYDQLFNDPASYNETIIKFNNYRIFSIEIQEWAPGLDVVYITATSEANTNNILWTRCVGPHGFFKEDQFQEGQVVTIWGVAARSEADDRPNVDYHYLTVFIFAME